MAGPDPSGGFDAADFRDQITTAMTIGLPDDVALRPTFRWHRSATYAQADGGGSPWDYADTPTEVVAERSVQVPCAVQVGAEAVEFRAGMQIDSARATLTLLDVHWAQVEGFDDVLLGGSPYTFESVLPQTGLFDVTVYQVIVAAVNES